MELPKKYCHNCGKQSPLGAKFCPSCGTSLASIDERPPGQPEPETVPNRVRPRVQSTFRPRVVGEEDDDDDTGPLRADKVGSLSELGIALSSLDCELRLDPVFKETVGGLVQQGKMSGPITVDSPRPSPSLSDKDLLAQMKIEGGTLRNT